jgi:hypothetical protein
LASLLIGCSTVRIDDPQSRVTFVARVPAWPWQDSFRALERLNISARTNSITINLRGLNETQAIGSNAVELVERTAGAVVRAAITSAK